MEGCAGRVARRCLSAAICTSCNRPMQAAKSCSATGHSHFGHRLYCYKTSSAGAAVDRETGSLRRTINIGKHVVVEDLIFGDRRIGNARDPDLEAAAVDDDIVKRGRRPRPASHSDGRRLRRAADRRNRVTN